MTLINFPKTVVPLSLKADVAAFFGPQDQDQTNKNLTEYRRGAGLVPSVNEAAGAINTGVPSSGSINLTDLLGSVIDFYIKRSHGAAISWSIYDSWIGEGASDGNGTRQILFQHTVGASADDEFEMAMGAKGQSQFRWKYTIISGDNADVNISSPTNSNAVWGSWDVSHDNFTLNLDIVNEWANTTVLIDVVFQARSVFNTGVVKTSITRRCQMIIADFPSGP